MTPIAQSIKEKIISWISSSQTLKKKITVKRMTTQAPHLGKIFVKHISDKLPGSGNMYSNFQTQ